MWIENLIGFALRQRLLVVVAFALVAAWGAWSATHLRIDALPDLTNNQVQVLTEAAGLAPTEVEKLVTYPIEVAMQGLPKVAEIRSTSKFALSIVTVVFDDDADPYFARQLVFERLQQAKDQLPAGMAEPALGPMTSGMGEIYMYTLNAPGKPDAMALRSLQDWVIRPQLRTVPGVTEINSFGGLVKQAHVLVEPEKLVAHRLTLHDVMAAVAETSSIAGGNFIEHNREQYIVRGLGLVEGLDDIRNTVVTEEGGVPIAIKDVATVALGPGVRQGAVTMNGQGEVVSGIVMMLRGANSREVIERVKAKVETINASLPGGVKLEPYYDQTVLVDKTIKTVMTNLLEGGALVVVILFLFLRNVPAALLVAATIPLAMGFAFIGMRYLGLSANLMSLGAIDFGLIVDGSVVMIENALRRKAEPGNEGKPNRQIVLEAAQEVGKPIFFGVAIILLVYLPILTLQGMEGKMFAPMALTVGFALLGSLLLSLFLVPVLATWLLPKSAARHREPVMDRMRSGYERGLRWTIGHGRMTLGAAGAVFLGSLLLVPALGTEFLPRMDEGSILVQPIRLPSISLPASLAIQKQIEEALLEFPEVSNVVSRTGRPDIASDPMGVNMGDTFVSLKPMDSWRFPTKAALEDAMRERLEKIPGTNFNFTQPIAMRVDELVSGVKSDVAIKLFGEDLEVLAKTGDSIADVVRKVPGAREVNVQQLEGQTYMNIHLDREALLRYGLRVSHVQSVIEAAIGGKAVGEIVEGQTRTAMVVRLPEQNRQSARTVRGLLIDTPRGVLVPLGQLAEVKMEEGPAEVGREDAQRRIVIEANVSGRDIGSFVAEARQAIQAKVTIPATYYLAWGGQFENQERAMSRLAVVVPLAIALIFALLYRTFNSLKQASLVLMILPLATCGGIMALWLRGMHLSVSAAIGFIALFGVAVLNGIVLVSTANRLREEGIDAQEAAVTGAVSRLRPVLMTALVASLGFVPMALSRGAGAEIQRPLATVVIGGLISATLLTLFVLPALYAWSVRQKGAQP